LRKIFLRAVSVLAVSSFVTCGDAVQHSAGQAAPRGGGSPDIGLVVVTNLTYHRPALYQSPQSPGPFHVIADYQHQSAVREYIGAWDDAAQALSAEVSVPLGAENLVYLSDAALPPGETTRITALRGTLKEVPCPANVDPLNSCLLLQVLH
jgi:hypothetical protein